MTIAGVANTVPTEGAAVRPIAMGDVVDGILRRRWWVISAAAAALAIAFGVVSLIEPVYRTQAHVLVESLETPFDRAQSDMSVQQRILNERDIASQIEVLASRDLQQRVVEALNLTDLPAVAKPALKLHHKILIGLGFKIDPRTQTKNQRALATLANALTIYPSPGSNVIIIRSSSSDADMAAELANTLAEFYVGSTRETAIDNTLRARDWLTGEIAKLREKVAASEAAAERFRAENGLLKGTGATLEAQELTELSTQLTLAQSAKLDAQSKADSIKEMLKKRGTLDLSTAAPESSLLQRLREQQISLSRQLAELSAVYLAQHPKIIALNRDIERLDDDIRKEAGKLGALLENNAAAASARETALRSKLENLMRKAASTNQDDVKLRALERDAAANRAVLETYLNRLSDANARVSLGSQPALARIIQRADRPAAPSFPKPGPMLLLAGLSGVTIGTGLAFMAAVMAEMANAGHAPYPGAPRSAPRLDPIRVAQIHRAVAEVMERPGVAGNDEIVPAMCELPVLIGDDNAGTVAASVLTGAESEFMRCMRQVASWAVTGLQTLSARRIAISGPAGSEIASATVAVALARLLSVRGDACILVDSDGRTGSLLTVLRIAPASGFGELLRGKASFREACRKDPLSKLDVMQAGHPPVGGDVIMGPLTADIMEMLERHYSFVIVHIAAPAQGAEPWKNFHAGLVVASAERAAEAGSIVKAMRAAGVASAQYLRLSAPAEPAKIGTHHATKDEARQQSGKEAGWPGLHQQPAPWLS
jgi:succinoglycan biosynthesis transport protein ExoP